MDATHDTLCATDLERLKQHSDEADARRWIPVLVAEVERLLDRMKDLERTRHARRSRHDGPPCPICGKPTRPADAVLTIGHGTMHGRCYVAAVGT